MQPCFTSSVGGTQNDARKWLENGGCPFRIVHKTRINLHRLKFFGGRFGDRLCNMLAKYFAVCPNSIRCILDNAQKHTLHNGHFGNRFEIDTISDLLDRDIYTLVTTPCIGLTHIVPNIKSFGAFVLDWEPKTWVTFFPRHSVIGCYLVLWRKKYIHLRTKPCS